MNYLFDCEEPPEYRTVNAAHRLIQIHRGCRCRSRTAALEVLTDAGHYLPAARFDRVRS